MAPPATNPAGPPAKRARKRFFEHIRTITACLACLVFPSWEMLMATLINSKPPPEVEKQIGA